MKLKGNTDVVFKLAGAKVKIDPSNDKQLQKLLKDIGAVPYKSKDKVIL